ncbi:TetR/AcrR family transcriptional regulator [Litoreibacter roseus]|uniref:TetR family transcriptional regulator n=1 Tax=Litoreibacter roseus TaxID=2601869 RepID=A0A6N6JKV7_9RHOB|nr:TetR/AcrR family transcriptional regulator [Litoreibacter roseus]GFE66577.1 TetR family transcriptional regulator [Litoreibacter roseus]
MTTKTDPSPSSRLRDSKRTAILDGAREVFLREGFTGGSVDAVAAKAGVGKQTVYRHFGSKDGLVIGLVRAMCDVPELEADAGTTGDLINALRRELRAFAEGLVRPESMQLYRAIVAEAERMPELGKLFYDAGPKVIRQRLTEILSSRFSEREAREKAEMLVQLTLGEAYFELTLGLAEADTKRLHRQIDKALRVIIGEG